MRGLLWWGGVAACGGAEVTSEEASSAGWYATDLHVHSSLGSNDAGEESTVDAIADVAKERGLAMVVITDHSNSAGSMDCPSGDVEDCPNQGPEFPALAIADGTSVQVGVEASPVVALSGGQEARGHIGCLPRKPTGFEGETDPLVDRPVAEIAGGSAVGWCQRRGGLAVVNHPFSVAGWLAYDWSSMAYDAIEVFNGGARFDAWDWSAVQAWVCDVSEGRAVVPVGGSDTHRIHTSTPPEGPLDQALGYPTTWVWAEDGTPESIMTGLVSGQTIVADPRTRLAVKTWTDSTEARPGQTLMVAGQTFALEVGVQVEAEGLILEIVDAFSGACITDSRSEDGAVPEVEPRILRSRALAPGEAIVETLDVDAENVSRVVVWVRPADPSGLGHSGVAIAAPIRVSSEP